MPLKGGRNPRQVSLGSQEQGPLCGILSDPKPVCAHMCLEMHLNSHVPGSLGEGRGLGAHVVLEETFNIHECDLLKGVPWGEIEILSK